MEGFVTQKARALFPGSPAPVKLSHAEPRLAPRVVRANPGSAREAVSDPSIADFRGFNPGKRGRLCSVRSRCGQPCSCIRSRSLASTNCEYPSRNCCSKDPSNPWIARRIPVRYPRHSSAVQFASLAGGSASKEPTTLSHYKHLQAVQSAELLLAPNNQPTAIPARPETGAVAWATFARSP